MSHNFINFHVLISHSPSCLNRDDMNMQKSAVFGGARRVRISSQSLKRSMRKSAYYLANLGQNSIRTKHIDELNQCAVERLSGRYEAELVTRTISLIAGKDASVEGAKDDAVAPWAMEEIAWFCEQVKQAEARGEDEKAIKKALKTSTQALHQALASCVDIALSGRMATSGLMSEFGKVDGALAVAHAITTHKVSDSDIDWFTAVDDLQELGSGHLDTQEFSSGVFYRYASLNLRQLQVNLGVLAAMDAEETAEGREQALDIAAHVLHMLTTVVPSAKQQSFAAHNLADLAMVSFSDLPISLANAFEGSIKQKGSGYLQPSIASLHDYWDKVHRGYGLNESCAEFLLSGDISVPDGVAVKESLEALKSWIRQNGE